MTWYERDFWKPERVIFEDKYLWANIFGHIAVLFIAN
jgi:hypothetical protein